MHDENNLGVEKGKQHTRIPDTKATGGKGSFGIYANRDVHSKLGESGVHDDKPGSQSRSGSRDSQHGQGSSPHTKAMREREQIENRGGRS